MRCRRMRQHAILRHLAEAAEFRPDAGGEFLAAERLGQVVVTSDDETSNLVAHRVGRGQEDDGT